MSFLSRWTQRARGIPRLDKGLICCALAASASATVATLLPGAGQPDYQRGDRFATITGLDPSLSPATVVIFLNTNCGGSQRSAETFQRIAQRPRPFRVVVIGYESMDLLEPFAQDWAIEPDAVLSAQFGSIRFTDVPRVALLDQAGIVRSIWSGYEDISRSGGEILLAANTLTASQVQ